MAVVEVRITTGDFGETMGQMRDWLDRRRVTIDAFRQSRFPGGLALHVDFKASGDAAAFAQSFGGRVLGTAPKFA